MISVIEADANAGTGSPGRGADAVELSRPAGARLFYQHVFSGCGCGKRDGREHVVRSGDRHYVHVGTCDRGLPVGKGHGAGCFG